MKNQIFIPTAPIFKEQIKASLEIQKPLIEACYNPGLMLVLLGGTEGLSKNTILQYKNLLDFKEQLKGLPIVTILSNHPLEEMDFINQKESTLQHVKRGIDFVANLPLGNKKIFTFHLYGMVDEDTFINHDINYWRGKFFYKDIFPILREISKYALAKGVEAKIETSTVPVFGDVLDSDERTYLGLKFNQLRNPFYLTSHWGFNQVREAGLEICLDICHDRTVYKTANGEEWQGLLYKDDIQIFRDWGILDDVKSLETSDLVHLNDGSGVYSRKNKTVFLEGVPLGQGDICNLREIIKYLNNRKIAYVIEINELNSDYINRPNLKASIDYLLKMN